MCRFQTGPRLFLLVSCHNHAEEIRFVEGSSSSINTIVVTSSWSSSLSSSSIIIHHHQPSSSSSSSSSNTYRIPTPTMRGCCWVPKTKKNFSYKWIIYKIIFLVSFCNRNMNFINSLEYSLKAETAQWVSRETYLLLKDLGLALVQLHSDNVQQIVAKGISTMDRVERFLNL